MQDQDMQIKRHQLGQLVGANKRDHYYELHYSSDEVARLYIISDGIFRYFLDPSKNFDENHTSFVDLSKFDNHLFEQSNPRATSDSLIIQSGNYQLIFQQNPAVMSIFDETLHHTRLVQKSPIEIGQDASVEILNQNKNEFYYGGGMQNGYFSHKGQNIKIKRDQIKGKGGVLTQVPFFWSNAGFGELRNTTAVGEYDFGKFEKGATMLAHRTNIFDNFYIIGESPKDILRKYYLLTGKPMLLPKYALDLGYAGNFLTTMWKSSVARDRSAEEYEDHNYYVQTYSADEASANSSLNGEENYQFSARAMIDRFQRFHFPLGWFIPNYENQEVDDEAISNFNSYAISQKVQPGLWTNDANLPATTSFVATNTSDSDLLKKDTQILDESIKQTRPLILSTTGNSGSQKNSAIAFGDIGGNWENIATQVAGFMGSNLSGQPILGSAVDGTEGGGNAQISIRDFEWKTFTPLLFSLDNQGKFSKTPFAYNSKMTKINRAYLTLRKQLRNYLYSLMYTAQDGEPIMRPFFIDFPQEQVNYTEQVGNEFMLGPNLLVAPITNGREDGNGDSRKDNLYLPNHRTMWVDLFTGKKFLGGRVFNKLSYPIWHLPVFVRGGAIFDIGERNFVLYPQGKSSFTFFDDNGSMDYAHSHSETKISSNLESGKLTINIEPVTGDFTKMETHQTTNLNIMCDSYPDRVNVKINDQDVPMQEYGTVDTFAHAKEGYFFNTNYNWTPQFSDYQTNKQIALQIKLANRDITDAKIEIEIQNFNYGSSTLVHAITDSLLRSPKQPMIDQTKTSAHSLTVTWPQLTDRVQIEVNGLLYDGIDGDSFTFHELVPNTRYVMRLRYVAGNKVSEWSDPFGAKTKPDALEYAIDNVRVNSNFESEGHHPLSYLTDLKLASEWKTLDEVNEENPLKLTFTFNKLENLSRMAFVPRNIDHDSDPTEVSVEVSTDGETFKPYGEHLTWKADSKNKVVGLRDVKAKAIRLTIYKSSGKKVAGREVLFFRDKNTLD